MSINSLCSIHTVQVRNLTATTDDLGATHFPVPSSVARYLKCRVVPMTERDRILYQQRDMRATHKFLFAEDPNVDNDHVIVYNHRVFRITDIHDVHELHRYFIISAYHDPQAEADL